MRVTFHFDIYPDTVCYNDVREKAISSNGKVFRYKRHRLKAIKDSQTLRVIKVSDIRHGIA